MVILKGLKWEILPFWVGEQASQDKVEHQGPDGLVCFRCGEISAETIDQEIGFCPMEAGKKLISIF